MSVILFMQSLIVDLTIQCSLKTCAVCMNLVGLVFLSAGHGLKFRKLSFSQVANRKPIIESNRN